VVALPVRVPCGTTPALLAYFVIKQMRPEKATVTQMLAAVLFATLLQLGIMFCFGQLMDQLPGIGYSAFAVVETFFVWLPLTPRAL